MTGLSGRAPKYHRIADVLRRKIADGDYADTGGQLPSETALSEEHRVSVPTVRQAIAVLRAEGLLESRHGIGTFVKESRRMQRRSRRRYGRARADRQLLTSHLRHEIVYAGPAGLPAHIAEAMGEEVGTEVIVRRRHLYDRESGQPEEVGASYLPLSIAAGTYLAEPTVVPKALFLCVEELSGKRYSYAHDQWTARMPTADEANTLDLPAGAPVVHVIHVARASDGSVLEVSESIWPADRVVVIDDYDIAADAEASDAQSEV
jgi:GntR family transcriptional regulator